MATEFKKKMHEIFTWQLVTYGPLRQRLEHPRHVFSNCAPPDVTNTSPHFHINVLGRKTFRLKKTYHWPSTVQHASHFSHSTDTLSKIRGTSTWLSTKCEYSALWWQLSKVLTAFSCYTPPDCSPLTDFFSYNFTQDINV